MKNKQKPEDYEYDRWNNDPTNWKFGIIYFNKQDKRIIVPKRVQELGWTLNFAHPYSIIGFILIFILLIIIPRLF